MSGVGPNSRHDKGSLSGFYKGVGKKVDPGLGEFCPCCCSPLATSASTCRKEEGDGVQNPATIADVILGWSSTPLPSAELIHA